LIESWFLRNRVLVIGEKNHFRDALFSKLKTRESKGSARSTRLVAVCPFSST